MSRLALFGALGALVAAPWWFVLRIGPRLATPDDLSPVTAEGALDHARRIATAERIGHADLVGSWAPTTATDVEVLPNGRTFYPRMLEDIASARRSIHLMQYGFTPGVVGDEFAPALVAKAREGVRVRLILDAVGSKAYGRSRSMLAELAAAGVEVMLHDAMPPDRSGPVGARRRTRRLDQTGRVEHRKLVLVDGRVAYIGGAGIEDDSADGRFHDVYVRVTGPVTRQLQALFLTSFRYHGGTVGADDPSLTDDGEKPESGGHPVTVIMNWPRGWLPLTDAGREMVEGATRRLDLTNPYIGDPGLIRAIADAARRGVSVRMVVSDEAHGNGVAYSAFKHHYDTLLDAGVEIWEYPALVHAKVIVSDDRALVGTLKPRCVGHVPQPRARAAVRRRDDRRSSDDDAHRARHRGLGSRGADARSAPARAEPRPRAGVLPALSRGRLLGGDPGLQLPVHRRRAVQRAFGLGPRSRVHERCLGLPATEAAV